MPQTGAIPDRANDVTPYWQAILDGMMDRGGKDDGKGVRNYLPTLLGILADPKGDASPHGPAMALLYQLTGDPRRIGGATKYQDGVINNLVPKQISKSDWANKTRGEASDRPGFYKDNALRRTLPAAGDHVDEYRRIMQMLMGGFSAGES